MTAQDFMNETLTPRDRTHVDRQEWTPEYTERRFYAAGALHVEELSQAITAALAAEREKFEQMRITASLAGKEADLRCRELAIERQRIKSLEQLITELPAQADLGAERQRAEQAERAINKVLRKMKTLEKTTLHGLGAGITPAKWEELKSYAIALAKVKEKP